MVDDSLHSARIKVLKILHLFSAVISKNNPLKVLDAERKTGNDRT